LRVKAAETGVNDDETVEVGFLVTKLRRHGTSRLSCRHADLEGQGGSLREDCDSRGAAL